MVIKFIYAWTNSLILVLCLVMRGVLHAAQYPDNTIGGKQMSAYEQQILATEQYYDREIRAVEASGAEVLSSFVPGSRLHQVIHNPYDEGIDEG